MVTVMDTVTATVMDTDTVNRLKYTCRRRGFQIGGAVGQGGKGDLVRVPLGMLLIARGTAVHAKNQPPRVQTDREERLACRLGVEGGQSTMLIVIVHMYVPVRALPILLPFSVNTLQSSQNSKTLTHLTTTAIKFPLVRSSMLDLETQR